MAFIFFLKIGLTHFSTPTQALNIIWKKFHEIHTRMALIWPTIFFCQPIWRQNGGWVEAGILVWVRKNFVMSDKCCFYGQNINFICFSSLHIYSFVNFLLKYIFGIFSIFIFELVLGQICQDVSIFLCTKCIWMK